MERRRFAPARLVEPREQTIELRFTGEGWAAAAPGFVRVAPSRDRLTFVRLDLSQASPARGLARTKQAIYGSWDRSLEAQLDIERDFQRELGCSSDYAEGVAAFSEKRTPRFTGQ